jgi:hypothetical protein
MYKIEVIKEEEHIFEFLDKRWLLPQYKKSKTKILNWLFSWVDFKIRQPKKDEIYSFRINRQFRAYWRLLENKTLQIYFIDNHQ